MYIQYTGFKVVMNSRIYNFQVLDAARESREFTVRIHSDTNLWAALKLQDGPGICFEKLEHELDRETPASCVELNLHIGEQDIREFLAHHYPPVKTFGHRDYAEIGPEPLHAPATARSDVTGQGLGELGSDEQKEVVSAAISLPTNSPRW
jgi:hypothetical protein